MNSLTPERGTGRILPEAVKEADAVGVLLNHAENRLPLDIISETIKRVQEVGLVSMVASSSPEGAEDFEAGKLNIEEGPRDQILKHISQKFKDHDLARLVEAGFEFVCDVNGFKLFRKPK